MTENEVLQNTFDVVFYALLTQGAPSTKDHGDTVACYYRNGELKCAVGHLLSDEQIAQHNIEEGTLADTFADMLVAELLPGVHTNLARKFLNALQVMHDSLPHNVEGELFRKHLVRESREVSHRFSLKRFE